MRTGVMVAIGLLLVVLAGGVMTANATQNVSRQFVSASRELAALTEGEQWQRAEETLSAYRQQWEEKIMWLQMLAAHEDMDNVTLAIAKLSAGIAAKDVSLCLESCEEMQEHARHIRHRDALTLGNVL